MRELSLSILASSNESMSKTTVSLHALTLKTNPCFGSSHICFGYEGKTEKEGTVTIFEDTPTKNNIH